MRKISFLGCGKMGRAIIEGVLRSRLYSPADICACDIDPAAQAWLRERGITPAGGNAEAVCGADLVFLLVKPYQAEAVIHEIRDALSAETVFVSIPLGLTLARLRELFGREIRLTRAMPNMPALIAQGMSGYCAAANVSDEELGRVEAVLEVLGQCERVSEAQMAAVTAVSGSAPAYVFLLIEAMSDAAVREGLPRDQALRFAAQAVMGSARLMQESKEHPAVLKDMICTPGGSTAEAVAVLEDEGFRSAVIKAMRACAEKASS